MQDPRPIERITYAELRELSYIGAQVLHEGTVSPVREKNIPLNIRNTNQPDHPGTMIRESLRRAGAGRSRTSSPASPAARISPSSPSPKTECPHEAGVLRQILEVLERYGINVDYLPSGIDTRIAGGVGPEGRLRACIRMLGDLQKELKPDSIHVTDNMAIVAAVGRKMAYKPGTSGQHLRQAG